MGKRNHCDMHKEHSIPTNTGPQDKLVNQSLIDKEVGKYLSQTHPNHPSLFNGRRKMKYMHSSKSRGTISLKDWDLKSQSFKNQTTMIPVPPPQLNKSLTAYLEQFLLSSIECLAIKETLQDILKGKTYVVCKKIHFQYKTGMKSKCMEKDVLC